MLGWPAGPALAGSTSWATSAGLLAAVPSGTSMPYFSIAYRYFLPSVSLISFSPGIGYFGSRTSPGTGVALVVVSKPLPERVITNSWAR